MGWRKFVNNDRGNVAIISALLAVPLLAVAGGAVDLAGRNSLEASMQKAVDAAVLAGAASQSERESRIRRAIRRSLQSNQSKYAGHVSPDDVKININISGDGVIRVSASAVYPTTLTSVIGIDGLNARAVAEARMNQAGAEIALVLDTTGSMTGSKIGALMDASRQFVDTAFEPNSLRANSVKAALVPYSQYVNVGTSNRHAGWIQMQPDLNGSTSGAWSGCVGSREAPWNAIDGNTGNRVPALPDDRVEFCPRPITPLTSDQTRLNSEINALTPSGNTYIPAGLVWGWRVLTPQAPFTEGAASAPGTNREVTKHLLLMTDGMNTLHKPAGQPEHLVGNVEEANTLTSALCENVKNAGITVYTVAFEVSDPPTEDMLRSCASGPENYYNASDSALLLSSFKSIADKIAVIRLSK